jgi:hypothetical protein
LDVHNSSDVGCGELWTTAEDLARWVMSLRDVAAGSGRLARRTVEPGTLSDGARTDYAFGQFLGTHLGLDTVSHSGKIAGYRSYLIRYPGPELAVIVLANASWLSPTALGQEIAEVYLDGHLPAEHAVDTKLVPLATGDFQGTNRWLRTVRFERDAAGAVTGLRVSALGVQDLRFARIPTAR